MMLSSSPCYDVGMFIPVSVLCLYSLGGMGAGLLSGLFGIGGGTIIVPLFLFLGTPFQQAVPLSLVYILFTSFSGSLVNWRHQRIFFRAVAVMSVVAVLGARVGVELAMVLSAQKLIWGFAAMMLVVLGLFFWRLHYAPEDASETSKPAYFAWVCIGLVAGLFSSLFGVGGGFLMVPLLVIFSKIELKQASGTSLASTFFISLGGLLQHFLKGNLTLAVQNHFWTIVLLSGLGLIAAPLGARLNHRLPVRILRAGFILFSLVVMTYMVYKGMKA